MHRHTGAITGDMSGNSIEAVGTNGTAMLSRCPPRCLSISGSTQRIGIHGKWSISRRFKSRITVTNRMTRSCANTIRSRRRQERLYSREALGRKNRGGLERETPGSRISRVLSHACRVAQSLRVHSLCKGVAMTFSGQPQTRHHSGARKLKTAGSHHNQSRTGVSSRHQDRRAGKKNSKARTPRTRQNADKDKSRNRSKSAAGIAVSDRS